MSNNHARRAAEAAFPSRVRKCAHPGCSRYSTRERCALHDPLPAEGEWIIAAQVKAENEGRER